MKKLSIIASKNKELINQTLKLCQSRLCAPTIEQVAAANLINTPKSYFEKVKAEYENRRNILYTALKEIPGVVCEKPTGAFYVVVKLPIENAEHFAKWLLTDYSYNNKTVMVAPAEGFYATEGLGKNEVRISYCLNCGDLSNAMHILKESLVEYKKSFK